MPVRSVVFRQKSKEQQKMAKKRRKYTVEELWNPQIDHQFLEENNVSFGKWLTYIGIHSMIHSEHPVGMI